MKGLSLSLPSLSFSNSKAEEKFSYWLLVLPALALYVFVMAFPLFFSLILSVSNYRGGQVFGNPNFKITGFNAYSVVFADPYFYISLKNNMYVVLVSILGQIPLGFILAYILSRGLIRGTDFFQAMIYLPNVIAAVVIGILFSKFFLTSNSVWLEIQQYFNPAAEYVPGNNPMMPVLAVILWMYTGFYVLIFLANLQKIDVSIIEATKIDGATEAQTLRYIIIPALSGIIVTSMILAISGSLRSFDLIYSMTGGGPARRTSVLALYMFDRAFRGAPNYPVANAISTIMMIISFVLIAITQTVQKFFVAEE